MALAEEIEDLVRRNPGLTDVVLGRMLQGHFIYQQQVNSACRRLVAEGRIERQGKGGWQHPFTYHPPTIKPPSPRNRRATTGMRL
jgi:hypothetical protein